MDSFKYEPIDLEGPAFRLLRLLKGGEPDIECELFQAWLHSDRVIPYEALSYTWGGTEMSASIKINGRTLNVTENLYLALRYLYSQKTDRILWVDAICIDQGNKKEQGRQVQQMVDIYSQTHCVILWLGPATDETKVLMDSLKQLEEESIKYACKDWISTDEHWRDLWSSIQPILKSQHWDLEPRQHAGLEFLLGRPWFKRVWILQEVASAKRAVVCSGTKSVSARIFALAPLLIGTKPDPHCQAVLDIMPGPSRKDSWWSQRRDLYTLLLKFNGSKASDPRDRIYALLGISSDGKDSNSLRADYTKTARQVVYDATSFLFGLSDSPYHTISGFLCNFTSLNTASLGIVIKSYNANDVASFLEQRGDKVEATEEVVKAAVQNTENGKEVMALLLKQRGHEVKITREVVKAAVGNMGSGEGVMALLLKQRGEEVVRAAVQSENKVVAILLNQRVDGFEITEELITEMARSFSIGSIKVLLKQRGDEIRVIEEVVKAAAGNWWSGDGMMELLLKQRGNKVRATEEVVKAAAGNGRTKGVIELLFRQRENEVRVTEEVVRAVVGNMESGKEVIT